MRLIDADALKKSIDGYDICDICVEKGARCVYDCPALTVIMPWCGELIDAQPTIEPKRGEWKKVKNVHAWDVSGIETWGVKRKCTNCDFRHAFIEDHGHYNFCPNCGADMREREGE